MTSMDKISPIITKTLWCLVLSALVGYLIPAFVAMGNDVFTESEIIKKIEENNNCNLTKVYFRKASEENNCCLIEKFITKIKNISNSTKDGTEPRLRLMSVAATDGLVNKDRNLVIVALVGTELHIRIFDASGKKSLIRRRTSYNADRSQEAVNSDP